MMWCEVNIFNAWFCKTFKINEKKNTEKERKRSVAADFSQ